MNTHDREGLTIFSFSIRASHVAESPFFKDGFLFSSYFGVGHHLPVVRHMPLHVMLSAYIHFYVSRIQRKRLHGTSCTSAENSRFWESTFRTFSSLSSAHILGGCESHSMACSGFEELIHLNCTLMFIKVLFNLQWQPLSCINPPSVRQMTSLVWTKALVYSLARSSCRSNTNNLKAKILFCCKNTGLPPLKHIFHFFQ